MLHAKNENTFGLCIDNVECLNPEKEWGLKNRNASELLLLRRYAYWGSDSEGEGFPSPWWKCMQDNLFPSNSNEVAAVWILWRDKKRRCAGSS